LLGGDVVILLGEAHIDRYKDSDGFMKMTVRIFVLCEEGFMKNIFY